MSDAWAFLLQPYILPQDTNLESGTVMHMAYLSKRGRARTRIINFFGREWYQASTLTGFAGTALQITSREKNNFELTMNIYQLNTLVNTYIIPMGFTLF